MTARIPRGFLAESYATLFGIPDDASRAQAPAPAIPTRPVPTTSNPSTAPRGDARARGNGLTGYLRAPAAVQDAFDRQIGRAIAAELDLERRLELDHADDELFDAERMRAIRFPRRVRWDRSWQRRATRPQPKPGQRAPYSRETDPLFDLDLREVWADLTGDEIRGVLAPCPNPDHDDRFPSCAVRDRLFFCNACGSSGSIVDLGALLYGIQPRGSGFFEIRNRLLAELGLDEGRAAA